MQSDKITLRRLRSVLQENKKHRKGAEYLGREFVRVLTGEILLFGELKRKLQLPLAQGFRKNYNKEFSSDITVSEAFQKLLSLDKTSEPAYYNQIGMYIGDGLLTDKF